MPVAFPRRLTREHTVLPFVKHEDKAAGLSEALEAVRQGQTHNTVAYAVGPASFRQVPGSPFAYWVSERIRRLLTELQPFEGGRAYGAGWSPDV